MTKLEKLYSAFLAAKHPTFKKMWFNKYMELLERTRHTL